jgi:hypothetical protein
LGRGEGAGGRCKTGDMLADANPRESRNETKTNVLLTTPIPIAPTITDNPMWPINVFENHRVVNVSPMPPLKIPTVPEITRIAPPGQTRQERIEIREFGSGAVQVGCLLCLAVR